MKTFFSFVCASLLLPAVSFASNNTLSICVVGKNVSAHGDTSLTITYLQTTTSTPKTFSTMQFSIHELPDADKFIQTFDTQCRTISDLAPGYYYYSDVSLPAGYSAKYNDEDTVPTRSLNDYFSFDRKGNTNSDGVVEVGGKRPNRKIEILIAGTKPQSHTSTHRNGSGVITPVTGSGLIDSSENLFEATNTNSSNIPTLGSAENDGQANSNSTITPTSANTTQPGKFENTRTYGASVGAVGTLGWLWLLLILPLILTLIIFSRDNETAAHSNYSFPKFLQKILKAIHVL